MKYKPKCGKYVTYMLFVSSNCNRIIRFYDKYDTIQEQFAFGKVIRVCRVFLSVLCSQTVTCLKRG